MTARKRWPTSAIHARDRSAEEAEIGARKTQRLLERVREGKFTRVGLERDLYAILVHQLTCARHLQSVGAPIEPE